MKYRKNLKLAKNHTTKPKKLEQVIRECSNITNNKKIDRLKRALVGNPNLPLKWLRVLASFYPKGFLNNPQIKENILDNIDVIERLGLRTKIKLLHCKSISLYLIDYFWNDKENEFELLQELNKLYPKKNPDLSNRRIYSLKNRQCKFQEFDLRNANFSNSSLVFSNFNQMDLRNVNFSNADLDRVDFKYSNLSNANLSGATLVYGNLMGANLRNTNLRKADLSGVSFKDADLKGADLSGANLYKSLFFQDANLVYTNFSNANLRETDLSEINLKGVNLKGADLRGTDLRGSYLLETNLTDAFMDNTTKIEVNPINLLKDPNTDIETLIKLANTNPIDFVQNKHIYMRMMANLNILDCLSLNSICNLIEEKTTPLVVIGYFWLKYPPISKTDYISRFYYRQERIKIASKLITYYPKKNMNLKGVDLSGADLSGADLSNTNLSEARLCHSDLSGADLSGANLRDADLRNIKVDSSTRLPEIPLNCLVSDPLKSII